MEPEDSVDPAELEALATVHHAAVRLHLLPEMRRLYPHDLDPREMIELHRRLVGELERGLVRPCFESVAPFYQQPGLEDDHSPAGIILVKATSGLLLHKALGLSEDAVPELHQIGETSFPHASSQVQEARMRVTEHLLFSCGFPHPIEDPSYSKPERYLFLLYRYWDIYSALLLQMARHPIIALPHPLGRYIATVRARIERCLAEVAQADLTDAVAPALQIEFSVDTMDFWEECGLPIVQRAGDALEAMRARMRLRHFDLTSAEDFFFKVARMELDGLDGLLTARWKCMLQPQDSPRKAPKVAWDYVRDVELELRKVARRAYECQYPTRWLDEVRGCLDGKARLAVESTMRKRGVEDPSQFLHYTQLSDLRDLISKGFGFCSSWFRIRKWEFNALMDLIIKGRTELAHNRPAHLWPEIERRRVEVACYDLLKAIRDPLTQGREPGTPVL